MSFLNQEKVIHSIQALLLYLNLAGESKTLGAEEIEGVKAKCLDLLQNLSTNQLDPVSGVQALNKIIEQMNGSLRAPYPYIPIDSIENFVKGEIVAFEHYLNQELKTDHLTIHEEAPLFNESLTLWEQVGVSLSAEDGISGLSELIKKLNRFLPNDEHYPKPE